MTSMHAICLGLAATVRREALRSTGRRRSALTAEARLWIDRAKRWRDNPGGDIRPTLPLLPLV